MTSRAPYSIYTLRVCVCVYGWMLVYNAGEGNRLVCGGFYYILVANESYSKVSSSERYCVYIPIPNYTDESTIPTTTLETIVKKTYNEVKSNIKFLKEIAAMVAV